MSSEGARLRRPEKKYSDTSKNSNEVTEEDAVKQASQGWIYRFFQALILTIVLPIVALIVFPSPISPVEITGLPEPPEFTGALTVNDLLSNAEQIYRGQVSGPESIVVDGDHIYTGTADGWVNDIHQGTVKKLVRFGSEPCGGIENENTCGRPLGMRMDKHGFLIVADAYFGLFQVNVVTGDYTTLYSSSTPVNGKTPKFLNDLDIDDDGKIYFTDTSTKWTRNNFPMVFLEGIPDGRLLMYDPVTKETIQLFEGLLFANGVQLTRDKTAVLVAETSKFRIMKFDLATKNLSVWSDRLPGAPDNIRYCKTSGTYWVGLALITQQGKPSFTHFLANRPWVRGVIAKVFTINVFLTLKDFFAKTDAKAMALELNSEGTIIRSLQDKNGVVIKGVSEVEHADGVMYFGSFNANYVGRLYRKRIPGL
ncbi:adipocyte plasma membrane-associated protein [Biomphalaria glabrata]|nr:adipocyte plasma membrane-associated protein [Biomphalaria glabrata]